MRVKDITISTSYFLNENDSILEASKLMKSERIRSLAVLDENNKLTGLITLREIIDAISSHKNKSLVKEAMLKSPVSVNPDMPIKFAVKIMLSNKFGCLPVLDSEGVLVGFIAEIDFLKPLCELAKKNEAAANLKIKNIMNPKPHTLKEGDKIIDSSLFMKEEKVRALAVTNLFGGLIGLVTLREIIDALTGENNKLLIKDAMINEKDIVSISPETSVEEAIEIMTKNKFNCLPVVNRWKVFSGFVTETDIFRGLFKFVQIPDDFYFERFGASVV